MVFVNNPLAFHSGKTFKINPSPRFISAEIEVANLRTPSVRDGRIAYNDGAKILNVLNKWSSSGVSDGSLPSTGFEINTAPASGDAFFNQINEINDALVLHGGHVDRSCGLHVHVDARDFTYSKMVNYIKIWRQVEEAMFRIVDPSRGASSYCVKVGDRFMQVLKESANFNETVDSILEGIYGDRVRASDMKNSRRPGCRYLAINLHSWIYRGTIENRMHQGTVDGTKIKNWGLLNSALIDVASEVSQKELNEIVSSTAKGLEYQLAFLVSIVPQEAKEWIIDRYKFFGKMGSPEQYAAKEATETVIA